MTTAAASSVHAACLDAVRLMQSRKGALLRDILRTSVHVVFLSTSTTFYLDIVSQLCNFLLFC